MTCRRKRESSQTATSRPASATFTHETQRVIGKRGSAICVRIWTRRSCSRLISLNGLSPGSHSRGNRLQAICKGVPVELRLVWTPPRQVVVQILSDRFEVLLDRARKQVPVGEQQIVAMVEIAAPRGHLASIRTALGCES